jgi:bla regulator protein blaR1
MNPISEIVVTYVTNALWMTCVIAAVTSLLSLALRRCPASYRHALWVAALLLAVSLPLASLGGSRQNRESRPQSVTAVSTTQAAETGVSRTSSWALWRRMQHGAQSVEFGPRWVGFVALFWLGFVFYRAARLYHGWRSIKATLDRSSEPQMPPAMRALVKRCHSRLGMKPVPMLLSPEGKGPATVGIRNPVLVLPEWFFSQASEDELSSVLGHELAHIRRHDFLLNLVYELLILPISFHPLATLIKARIDQTRELACDEIASECLSTRTQYTRSLLSIAQSMTTNQRPAVLGYALGLFDTNTLEDRVVNLLERANRVRKARAQSLVLATLTLLIVTCLGVSGFSFQVNQTHTDADLQPFVGTWHAQFQGKTFLTVKLEQQQGKLTGSVSHADLQVGKDGELTSAEAHEGSDPIVEAKLMARVLLITTKEQDSDDTIQCEMKLTGTDQAELRILAPPDVPTPKPWKLERAKPSE